ncbi:hypothetical protein HK101_001854 [Irineochytrium annulatum]|nr:hypothetical protein HK101_001854 [Irineochytrium annulatum]
MLDPQTYKKFYANIVTGECSWEKPTNAIIKTKETNEDEWWELFDENHKLPYFYNTRTRETEWLKPDKGIIIPLMAIQNSSIGKRVSVLITRGAMDLDPASSQGGPTSAPTNSYHTNLHSPTHSPAGSSSKLSSSVPLHGSSPLSSQGGYAGSSPNLYQSGGAGPSGSSPTSSSSNLRQSPSGTSFKPTSTDGLANGSRAGAGAAANGWGPGAGAGVPMPNGANGEAWKAARSQGISGPVNNPEAAMMMSPLANGGRSQSQPVAGVRSPKNANLASLPKVKQEITKILPSELKKHIMQFQIDGFAKKYFAEHRKGIFRRKVPLEKMLMYQKEALRTPLMVLVKPLRHDALQCFRIVQKVMADTSPGPPYKSTLKDVQWLLEKGIMQGGLRDEIYVQLCKQVNKNPSFESTFRGWVLLCVITIAFPPSKNFEDYMRSFTHQHFEESTTGRVLSPEGEKIAMLARHCDKKLMRICKSGPRGKTPSIQEIERAQEAPFQASLFGETLEDIMRAQEEMDARNGYRPSQAQPGEEGVPRILPFLADSILKLNGCRTEGIFRVPGDADSVTELRCRIEKGNYDMSNIQDPNAPASLLKFWLRDLAEPLIPSDLYDACIAVGASEGTPEAGSEAANIVERLPDINREVANYMIRFLKIVAEPQNQPITRMTAANIAMVFAPNFLRCPSDNPTTIFENTKFEQAFLRILLSQ